MWGSWVDIFLAVYGYLFSHFLLSLISFLNICKVLLSQWSMILLKHAFMLSSLIYIYLHWYMICTRSYGKRYINVLRVYSSGECNENARFVQRSSSSDKHAFFPQLAFLLLASSTWPHLRICTSPGWFYFVYVKLNCLCAARFPCSSAYSMASTWILHSSIFASQVVSCWARTIQELREALRMRHRNRNFGAHFMSLPHTIQLLWDYVILTRG